MRFPITLTLAVLLPVCAFAAKSYKKGKPKDIDTLYALYPVSMVFKISHGDEAVIDDSLTYFSNQRLTEVLMENAEKIGLRDTISVTDRHLAKRLSIEVYRLAVEGLSRHYYEDLYKNSLIDSFMDATGRRFVLLLFNSSFSRTGENYRNKGGEFLDLAVKSGASITALIIDAKENKTLWYKRHSSYPDSYANPLNKEVLRKEFKAAFEGFFWKKTQNDDPYRKD